MWLCGAVVGGVGESGVGRVAAGLAPGPEKKGRRREDTLELKPEAAQAPSLDSGGTFSLVGHYSERIHPLLQWISFYAAFHFSFVPAPSYRRLSILKFPRL